jgi:hypothetical protein
MSDQQYVALYRIAFAARRRICTRRYAAGLRLFTLAAGTAG